MKDKFKPINFNSKNVFVALFTTIFLFVLRVFLLSPFISTLKDEVISEIIVYTILIVAIFIIERKTLIKQLKSFKKDVKNKWLNVLIVTVSLLVAEYFINLLLIHITKANPSGQDLLQVFLKRNIFTFILYSCLFIPILESLFYYYPYKNISNKKLGFVFSAIVFAAFHMLNANHLIELLYIIPYSLMALSFGYGLYKTNNIYVTILIHIINNIVAVMLLLI